MEYASAQGRHATDRRRWRSITGSRLARATIDSGEGGGRVSQRQEPMLVIAKSTAIERLKELGYSAADAKKIVEAVRDDLA